MAQVRLANAVGHYQHAMIGKQCPFPCTQGLHGGAAQFNVFDRA